MRWRVYVRRVSPSFFPGESVKGRGVVVVVVARVCMCFLFLFWGKWMCDSGGRG